LFYDLPSEGILPKLNICKIFDVDELSFSALMVIVNVSRFELSGIRYFVSNNPLSFVTHVAVNIFSKI
jgi:thiamine pyrophosphokinase